MTVTAAKVVRALRAVDPVNAQYILRQRNRQKKNAPVRCLPHIWGIKTGFCTKSVRNASKSIHSPKGLLGIEPHSSGCSVMPKPAPKIATAFLAI